MLRVTEPDRASQPRALSVGTAEALPGDQAGEQRGVGGNAAAREQRDDAAHGAAARGPSTL